MASISIPSATNLIKVPVNGGNLFAISLQYLGTALQWNRIAALNGLKDPVLPPGVAFTLLIPPADSGATDNGYVTGGWGTVSVPVNTALPVIIGAPNVTYTINATVGTWTTLQGGPSVYAPISYTYQWNTNGVPNAGATGSSYIIVNGDLGLPITVTVTATNIGGSASAISLPASVVIGAPIGPSLAMRLDWSLGTLPLGA